MHTHGGELTYEIAEAIRVEYAAGGVSQQTLADRHGVSQVMVSNIIRGKLWVRRLVPCQICGVEFTPTSPTARYCSQSCFEAGRRLRAMRRWREAHPFAELTCPHCGDSFTQSRLDQRFCTDRCMNAAHNALRKAKWRVRGKGGEVIEEVSRAYIIKRDKSRCHLCGKRCKADEIHLDHVLPLALGGDHSAANVRVACAVCNMAKHTSARNEQLSMIG